MPLTKLASSEAKNRAAVAISSDSTVFSAADREATHLLEGLLRHALRPTDVHSTDTHGYTEVIFAVTWMLGIAYDPRIRQLTNQQLYS